MAAGKVDDALARFGLQRSDLAGAALTGEIPIPNAVINRFIAQQLAQRNLPVAAVAVEAVSGDAVGAQITPKARLMPPVRILARIEKQPNLPHDATLGLRWSMPGMGALSMFAAPALSFFKALPPGIAVDGDRITVDMRQLLIDRGFGDLLPYLTGLRIGTREGAVVIKFDVRA